MVDFYRFFWTEQDNYNWSHTLPNGVKIKEAKNGVISKYNLGKRYIQYEFDKHETTIFIDKPGQNRRFLKIEGYLNNYCSKYLYLTQYGVENEYQLHFIQKMNILEYETLETSKCIEKLFMKFNIYESCMNRIKDNFFIAYTLYNDKKEIFSMYKGYKKRGCNGAGGIWIKVEGPDDYKIYELPENVFNELKAKVCPEMIKFIEFWQPLCCTNIH